MSRYGVGARYDGETGGWSPVSSYPDFEGVTPDGRQFIFDAKVCSQPSFKLDRDSSLFKLQFRHLMRRSKFGVTCFLLIHFNGRKLAKKVEPEFTAAIEVREDSRLWEEFDRIERKSISRAEAEMYGIVVPWNKHSERAVKDTPDLMYAIKTLRGDK
jgi:penicillin-binding protein-related factor A (putative recombinase)